MLPKYDCWDIWLSRNKKIFSSSHPLVRSIALKALSSCFEFHHAPVEPSLDPEEMTWITPWVWPLPSLTLMKISPPHTPWILCLNRDELVEWKKKYDSWIRQFDIA